MIARTKETTIDSPPLVKMRSYMDDVRSGRRIAGKREKDAVKRFRDDRKKSRTKDFRYRFDEDLADYACHFFESLQHTDGEYHGQKFLLQPWQCFVVANLFGWVEKETGLRRFREGFVSVARGNGKSPLGAGIMMLLLTADIPFEHRAEVYCTATTRDQASIAWNQAKRWSESCDIFRDRVEPFRYHLQFGDSKFEPRSSDGKSADGLVIHGLLRDELHSWQEHQRDYYQKLSSAMGKRRQPLAVTITTAGTEESDIWLEEYSYATQAVDRDAPVTADRLFVYVCEIDDDDDELDSSVWPKANPMLECGVVKYENLVKERDKAKADPSFRPAFRRYYCNKLAYTSRKLFTAADWKKGSIEIPFDQVTEVFAGLDLGWVDDLAAVGYVAPLDWISVEGRSKRRYAVWCDSWIPAGSNRDLTREPFASLIRTGRLIRTDSESTDMEPIYESIEEVNNRWGIQSLAYDPANNKEMANNCQNHMGINTYSFFQSHQNYNEPLREFGIALSEGRILHAGDDLLCWTALNVVTDANHKDHKMPSKRRSQDKIDPFVAVLMAFSEALFSARQTKSVYETRGPIVV